MNGFSRRRFLVTGLASILLAPSCSRLPNKSVPARRVVVVGGGFGGATAARYIKVIDPSIDVVLVEPKQSYVTCPFSNAVLGGIRDFQSITHTYTQLTRQYGINVIHAKAKDIDSSSQKVTLEDGRVLPFDRAIVSPGIDFRWDQREGYNPSVAQTVPHAWQAGEQTELLRRQLVAMDDGGTVIIAPPGNPFRCPPAPYERASLIAHYLSQHKPKSKILILDSKDKFSKQALFQQGWDKMYPGMIEWVAGSDGGHVSGYDARARACLTGMDQHSADVINIIPPQKAGVIAHRAGLADDSGWCPVNQKTFESRLQKNVHVIGDACIAGAMPKSGFAANNQAKVCAAAIVSEMNGLPVNAPTFLNTCFSLLNPIYGVSVAMAYRLVDGHIVKVTGAGGLTPMDADRRFHYKEAKFAKSWYQSIVVDSFG